MPQAMLPSSAQPAQQANSATIELSVCHALLATIKRIISLTPTAPSVLWGATSQTMVRTIASIAKEGSTRIKKPSSFAYFAVPVNSPLQTAVQSALRANTDDTSQELG